MIPRYCKDGGCGKDNYNISAASLVNPTNVPSFYHKSIGMDMPGMKPKEKGAGSAYVGYLPNSMDALYLILGKQKDPRKSPDNPQKALYAALSKMALSPESNYVMQ